MLLFTAAPVLTIPATSSQLAYTTFRHIYIREGIPPREREVVLKHEQSHIWLRHHQRRGRRDAKAWNIAADVEIALGVYTAEDTDIILAPLSVLRGGITVESFPDLPPDIQYAEQIYDWLLDNGRVCSLGAMGLDLTGEPSGEDEPDEEGGVPVEELVPQVKAHLGDAEKAEKSQNVVAATLRSIKSAPPSLGGALDAALRSRFEREASFRRPTRRERSDFIEKGRITAHRNPLVEIFIDRSGSFTPQKTKAAEEVLSRILTRYRATVRADVFFFGAGRLDRDGLKHGGDTPYALIIDHIRRTMPEIAVVVTDDDPAQPTPSPKGTEILVVPVGARQSCFANAVGGKDVSL